MQYRRIGNTGLKVSAISLGAWLTYGSSAVEFDTAAQCMHTAIEHGINYIDVADIYARGSAEETVGKVIKEYDRSKLVIATKCYWPMSDDPNDRGLSRKHIFESVHKSLKRLGTDYVDMFFFHRYDDESPTEESVRAINDLIEQGKILYYGTSMWPAHGIEEAQNAAVGTGSYRPVVEQPVYNMIERHQVEGAVEEVIRRHGMGLVVWSPLASGLLTGKYNDGIPQDSRAAQHQWVADKYVNEDNVEKVRKLTEIANELGTSMAALALAWLLKKDIISSVITGASKPSQVVQNLSALDVSISDEVEAKIEAILDNKVDYSKGN